MLSRFEREGSASHLGGSEIPAALMIASGAAAFTCAAKASASPTVRTTRSVRPSIAPLNELTVPTIRWPSRAACLAKAPPTRPEAPVRKRFMEKKREGAMKRSQDSGDRSQEKEKDGKR